MALRSVLDLVVDGEIVKEAMILDLHEEEQVIYKGPGPLKAIYDFTSIIVRNLNPLRYCIFHTGTEKYVVLRLTYKRYMAVRLEVKANGEEYVNRIKDVLERLKSNQALKDEATI